jgi:fermentation-respiration switch protein FrsA (DUF1100 family)
LPLVGAPVQRFLKRSLAIAALVLSALYCLAVLWLMSQETRLVFQAEHPFETAGPSFPYRQVDITRQDGAVQYAWAMNPGADAATRPWVLFLHGNASTIASRLNIAHYQGLLELDVNVLAPEYRGYGGLAGTPTERGLDEDGRAAYEFLRAQEHVEAARIVIYGWSLGSGVAIDLASHVPVGAVILEGAPASLVAIGERQYPMLPIRLVMRNPFDSILKIDRVRAPLLFLHSPEDTIVPISEGRRLFDAAVSPKTFVEVPGGHIHASETQPSAFYGAIRSFLQEHRLLGEGRKGRR